MKRIAGVLVGVILISGCPLHAQVRHAQLMKDGSVIKYHMSHPLHEFDAVSKDAVYKLDLDPTTKELKSISAEVDVTTFDSGNSNRDSHAMEVIDALTYPEVTFMSTGITQVADSVRVAGKLTFHGVTRDIVVPGELAWSQNRLDVHGQFDISLTEFKVERPSLLLIPVGDAVRFTVVAVFKWD